MASCNHGVRMTQDFDCPNCKLYDNTTIGLSAGPWLDMGAPCGFTVLTSGTFDVLHSGHIELLSESRKLAGPDGKLVVGLNSDRFIEQYRGKPPVMSWDERASILQSIRYVDSVVMNDGDSKVNISEVRPDILTVGSDWAAKDIWTQMGISHAWLTAVGATLVYLPRPSDGPSSTQIKSMISGGWQ